MDKEKVAAELGALAAVIYKLRRGTTLPTDRVVDLILEFQEMDESALVDLKEQDLALKKFLVARGFVEDW